MQSSTKCIRCVGVVPQLHRFGTHLEQATWSTPGFLEFHRRMQLFILLLIEGGSYLQEDEDKWEFILL